MTTHMTAGIDGNTRQASKNSRLGPTEATICIFQLLSMHKLMGGAL